MSENYEDILSMSWDQIPVVKLLPVGSYLLRSRSASFQPAKEAGKNASVMFVYTVKEPMDDVKTEELADLGEGYDLDANRIFKRFYIETAADWDQVRKHLVKHQVELTGSILETLKTVKGHEVIGYLEQRSFVNAAGEAQQNNEAVTFAPVEA